jgi:lysyl-tRNA synthetase class 2
VKKDALGEQFQRFQATDLGDFVGVTGTLFRSKTGELTLAVTDYRPLTKALRPLPEKWHGLTDVETRYRQRYLDLVSNPAVKDVFLRRTQLVRFLREFLDARDFVEVETPMMHPLVSGAAARPFTTHHNALDIPLFMRIAPELYLKRLVVGGLERVYEINRNFRNEGISTRHNPEFTMLEWYQAYATYEDLMSLTEEMVSGRRAGDRRDAGGLPGTDPELPAPLAAAPDGRGVRAAFPAWMPRTSATPTGSRPSSSQARGTERNHLMALNAGEMLAVLFEHGVEPTLLQPTFVTEFPTEVSPLARRNDVRPEIADRFELFIMGREIANGFSELNDPRDQQARFEAQVEAKRRGATETMNYDEDYIRALERGCLPPRGAGGRPAGDAPHRFALHPRRHPFFPLLKAAGALEECGELAVSPGGLPAHPDALGAAGGGRSVHRRRGGALRGRPFPHRRGQGGGAAPRPGRLRLGSALDGGAGGDRRRTSGTRRSPGHLPPLGPGHVATGVGAARGGLRSPAHRGHRAEPRGGCAPLAAAGPLARLRPPHPGRLCAGHRRRELALVLLHTLLASASRGIGWGPPTAFGIALTVAA